MHSLLGEDGLGRMIVYFSKEEVGLISRWVDMEQENVAHRRANRTRRDLSRKQEDTDWIGLAGEFAVAKSLCLPIESCSITQNGLSVDDGHDIKLPIATIQVKTIEVRNVSAIGRYDFRFTMEGSYRSEFKSDYGILSFLHPCRTVVQLGGYITRGEFLAMNDTVDLGTGVRACCPVSKMHDAEKLINELRGRDGR